MTRVWVSSERAKALAGFVAGEAEDSFFGGDGDAAWFEEVGAEGGVFVEIDLGEAMGGGSVGEDDAAPEVAGVLPGDAEVLVVVVALGDGVGAAEIADETAEDGGVGQALIGNFFEFGGRHAAPPVEEAEFIRAGWAAGTGGRGEELRGEGGWAFIGWVSR